MADQVKGLAAVNILNQEDVVKQFTNADNPIPIQVISGLGFMFNKNDDFAIRKEYKEMGDTAGGDMIRKRLIVRYTDEPKVFTLKQFIDQLVNHKTNASLRDVLLSHSSGHLVTGNLQITAVQSRSSAEAAEPILGNDAVQILESKEVAPQFNLVDAADLASDLSPWFIRKDDKEKIKKTAQNQSNKIAANDLLDEIVAHFKQGRRDISLQDLIDVLKKTGKYSNLITALENACKCK